MNHYTIFNQLQDDSNLRQLPPKNTSAKGKCIYPNLRWPPPKNKTSVRKLHTLSTQSLSDSIYFTNQCHCLHHQSQCLHLTHTFSLTSSPSSLSFCNIWSLVPSTAKDIQHYLKLFTVTCGEMCFHAILIHIE